MKKTIAVVLVAASMTFGLAAAAQAQGRPHDKGPSVEAAKVLCLEASGTWLQEPESGTPILYWSCLFDTEGVKLPKLRGNCRGVGGKLFVVTSGPNFTNFVCSSIS